MASLPFNEKKGCPDGFHKRSSYTSKSGHRVPPRCVKAQTTYKNSRKNYTRRITHKFEQRLAAAGHARTRKLHCPRGKVERKGYVRRFGETVMKKGYTVRRGTGTEYRIKPEKSSIYVKPGCVKDRGDPNVKTPGPGKSFGLLRKGELKKHGYIFREPRHVRHIALNKAIKEFGPLGVYHKLDAVAKLSKHSAPMASRVFREDREWLKHHYKLHM
jgi:hypothetical protein